MSTYADRMAQYRFEAQLWRHDGDAAWHFVTLPADVSDDIEATVEPKSFGSVPVRIQVGGTTWETSLFPDKGTGSHVLPIKRSIREAEAISDGDEVTVQLTPIIRHVH